MCALQVTLSMDSSVLEDCAYTAEAVAALESSDSKSSGFSGSIRLGVKHAVGHKCERCWNYSPR